MARELEGSALVSRAAEIAEALHQGQVHSFGEGSYFNMHLKPVAEIVRRLGYGATYIAGAYLHDTKEDTSVTDKQLIAEGIPHSVVHAINLMAKVGDPHDDYLAGILTCPIATVDKYADSSFNFSWTTINSPHQPDEDFTHRQLQYGYNISVLRPHLPKTE